MFISFAIVLLGIIAFALSTVDDRAFSLQRNGYTLSFIRMRPNRSHTIFSEYTDNRITKDMRVIYYVKADFMKHYRGRVEEIGKQVEHAYLDDLRSDCRREQSQSLC